MASNSELYLMTQLLNLSGVKVIDYRLIEGLGIILSLENTKKQLWLFRFDYAKKKGERHICLKTNQTEKLDLA